MAIYKAIRTALGKAFMGDTFLAKSLSLSSPDVFDDRLVIFLLGLQQLSEPAPSTSISGTDIRALFASLHATSNANRISALGSAVTLTGQFGTSFLSTNGASAFDTLTGGFSITSDGSNALFHLSRVGPKAWSIFISMPFLGGTPIEVSNPVRWDLNCPDILTPGTLFKAFFDQLPTIAEGPIYFDEIQGPYSTTKPFPIGIARGSGNDSMTAFSLISPSIIGPRWAVTADDVLIAQQLSRTFSGMVILP